MRKTTQKRGRTGQKWSTWPTGLLRKGDLLDISYNYLGVHGPVHHRQMLILLESFISRPYAESWHILVTDESGQQYHDDIYCDDFKSGEDDWQCIELISASIEM